MDDKNTPELAAQDEPTNNKLTKNKENQIFIVVFIYIQQKIKNKKTAKNIGLPRVISS
jgi:hypothetical protein